MSIMTTRAPVLGTVGERNCNNCINKCFDENVRQAQNSQIFQNGWIEYLRQFQKRVLDVHYALEGNKGFPKITAFDPNRNLLPVKLQALCISQVSMISRSISEVKY